MARKRLFWQVFPPYLLVIVCALLAVTAFSTRTLRGFWLERTAADLEARAHLVGRQYVTSPAAWDRSGADVWCEDMAEIAGTRLTIVGADGVVWGDSDEDPKSMDNHGGRPEIRAALEGRVGSETRFSHTLQETLKYVAVPIRQDGEIVAAVRVALPVTFIERALHRVRKQIALAGVVVAVLASALGFWIAQRIAEPLRALREGAERFARGDFQHKLPLPHCQETAALAESMNQMAEQLDDRIRTVVSQRNEQEAVLSSMLEGVLALDREERVITINSVAAELLGIPVVSGTQRTLQEMVRNPDLQAFASEVLGSQGPIEREITLHGGEERFLWLRGTSLRDANDRCIGAVIVLSDVTRTRKLEHLRRDFVANVSHELRTPITSIKGFVETLLDGALEEEGEARRFLGIVAAQVDRLNAIIEDLLSLSRLDESETRGEIVLAEGDVSCVVRSAVAACEAAAGAKGIRVELEEPEEKLAGRINARLLEQAVLNLLDNAVKYSDSGGAIRVGARVVDDTIQIHVADDGCGIAEEHFDRLFERFYRVDRARSRQMGGTGLGLAIVKHIAQAHKGRVTVESVPSVGSTFTLILPRFS